MCGHKLAFAPEMASHFNFLKLVQVSLSTKDIE